MLHMYTHTCNSIAHHIISNHNTMRRIIIYSV